MGYSDDEDMGIPGLKEEVLRIERRIKAAEVRQDEKYFRATFEAAVLSAHQQIEYLTFESWFEKFIEDIKAGIV